MARRNNLFLLVVGVIATFVCISLFFGGGDDNGFVPARSSAGRAAPGESDAAADPLDLDSLGSVLSGGVIAPKLGNETAK